MRLANMLAFGGSYGQPTHCYFRHASQIEVGKPVVRCGFQKLGIDQVRGHEVVITHSEVVPRIEGCVAHQQHEMWF